jgi:hypothetical protein
MTRWAAKAREEDPEGSAAPVLPIRTLTCQYAAAMQVSACAHDSFIAHRLETGRETHGRTTAALRRPARYSVVGLKPPDIPPYFGRHFTLAPFLFSSAV